MPVTCAVVSVSSARFPRHLRGKNTVKQLEQIIRVGAVSYLNTRPLLFGIERLPVRQRISLHLDYPSALAKQLANDEIDLGLVPVAILPALPHCRIVGHHCIGATGKVGSVSLFSQVPLEQIETVLLDYQSRTSVALVQVLLKHFWKKQVKFEPASEGYMQHIAGTTAGVVIGDRAFAQRQHSAYEYDLAEAWVQYTGLPFVFAAWVANKPLPPDFEEEFDQANQYGLQHLDEVIRATPSPHYDLRHYFTHNISYILDKAKLRGLELFLKLSADS
jgi:chorismate dehydratase